MYKVAQGGGRFMKSAWEVYEVVKRGREYHGSEANITWKKGNGEAI